MHNLTPKVTNVIMANPLILRDVVPPEQVSETLKAFVKSISKVFVLPIAASSVGILLALAGEWVRILRDTDKAIRQSEHKGSSNIETD